MSEPENFDAQLQMMRLERKLNFLTQVVGTISALCLGVAVYYFGYDPHVSHTFQVAFAVVMASVYLFLLMLGYRRIR